MENEQNGTILSMLFNTLMIISKIYGGIIMGSYTLICSGYYSLCDLITEFVAFFASTIRGRRASIKNPFGYGSMEQNASKLFGVTFVLFGVYVAITSFDMEFDAPSLYVILLLIAVIVIRFINIDTIFLMSKNARSNVLMEATHNAYYDLLLNALASIIIIISFFINIADLVGCILFGICIIIKGVKIIIHNIILTFGQNDTSKAINAEIKKIVNSNKNVNYIDVDLINVRDYYKAIIEMEIDDTISFSKLFKIENNIRKEIKSKKLKIRFIDIESYLENN